MTELLNGWLSDATEMHMCVCVYISESQPVDWIKCTYESCVASDNIVCGLRQESVEKYNVLPYLKIILLQETLATLLERQKLSESH